MKTEQRYPSCDGLKRLGYTRSSILSGLPAAMTHPNALPVPLAVALDAAVTAAHTAASIIQAYASDRSQLVVDAKARNDLVSQADREAEAAILQILRERTPQCGIVAEESGGIADAQANWYIDPLDGTTNFLHAVPHYAVSIALVARAGTVLSPHSDPCPELPVVGVIYDPNRAELFTAVHGGGAWLNGHRIRVARNTDLDNALLATGFPFRDFSFANEYLPTLEHAMHHSRGVRRFGSAALDLAWVACGRYDAYWEMGLAPWDVAAGTVLVREAGGQVLDLRKQLAWPSNGEIIAGTPAVVEQLQRGIAPHLNN